MLTNFGNGSTQTWEQHGWTPYSSTIVLGSLVQIHHPFLSFFHSREMCRFDIICIPASCGKFAEISRDLYKKYIHRCLDYFLRVNSNSFPRTSGCQVWETVLDRIGFDTIFLHDFLIKFQTLTFSEVTFSAICERSQRHKNPQAMTFYNRIRNSSSTYRSEMSEMTEWHFSSFQCLFSNSAMTFAE